MWSMQTHSFKEKSHNLYKWGKQIFVLNYQQNKATYTSLLFNEIIFKENSDKLKTLNYCISC